MNKSHRVIIILTLVLCHMLYGSSLTLQASEGAISDPWKILFISSYTESFLTVPDQIKGLNNVLDPLYCRLDIEYMDTKRISGPDNITLFYENLAYKLSMVPSYDLVLVGDDAALQFMIDYRQDLFAWDIPVVFFGINSKERAYAASLLPNMTGGIEEASLIDNILLGTTINPSARSVTTIVDNTLTGQGDQKQFEDAMLQVPQLTSQILNVGKYSFAEFGEILENLPSDTLLLFQSMNVDQDGVYMDIEEQFAFLKEHTNIPVLRASVGGVGKGLLGGKMISYTGMAEEAANIALFLLDGGDISQVSLTDHTVYHYYFDYPVMQKYNISRSLLPEDAVLNNYPENPFTTYRDEIMVIILCFIFVSSLALILLFDSIKHRKLQRKLQDKHEELSATYEELIASEETLHTQFDTIQKHAQEVDILNQRYEIAIESTASAVWDINLETEILTVSHNLSQILEKELPAKEHYRTFLPRITTPEISHIILQHFEEYLTGHSEEIHLQIPALSSHTHGNRWILIRGRKICKSENETPALTGIILDVTEMKLREDYVQYMARHDYLTNLPNRRYFMDLLTKELERGNRGAILLFDLDEFKTINDTMGHLYGDQLLIAVAERLQAVCKQLTKETSQVTAARLGGDEFLVLIHHYEQFDTISHCVDVIRSSFADPFLIENTENHLTFSMGITCYPSDSMDIEQLLMNADMAMYKVKKSGKNNSMFYKNEMIEEMQKKKKIEALIRQSLLEQQFILYFQPQISLHTLEVIGYEALLRIQGNPCYPSDFIPVAEEDGQIIEIGRFVAKEAILQLSRWQKKGLPAKKISINYSSKQIKDRGFLEYVKQLLQEHQVSPRLLCIEITEGILLENNQATLLFLKELQEYGFPISLDDFGTGYSSLNYLTYIPVDTIKLDKSICDKFLSNNQIGVMESLIQLAHSLHLQIVAEGIETRSNCKLLKDLGCDAIQGYVFSKPLPIEEAETYYLSRLDC